MNTTVSAVNTISCANRAWTGLASFFGIRMARPDGNAAENIGSSHDEENRRSVLPNLRRLFPVQLGKSSDSLVSLAKLICKILKANFKTSFVRHACSIVSACLANSSPRIK